MTKNYYKPSNYRNHSTCGSKICNYDFDGYVSMTSMVERIISDWKFDEKYRKLANNKQKGITNGKNRI